MKEKDIEVLSWITQGKIIKGLIAELSSFEDQDLFVEISLDGGDTSRPISLVKKSREMCLLVSREH